MRIMRTRNIPDHLCIYCNSIELASHGALSRLLVVARSDAWDMMSSRAIVGDLWHWGATCPFPEEE